MVARPAQTVSVLFVLALLLVSAVATRDGVSTLFVPGTEGIGDPARRAGFGDESSNLGAAPARTCNDDSDLFAVCEATLIDPLQRVASVMGESPTPLRSVDLAENFNAGVTDSASRRCLALTGAQETDRVENDANPAVPVCCRRLEVPAAGAAHAASGASDCSCDPLHCQCT